MELARELLSKLEEDGISVTEIDVHVFINRVQPCEIRKLDDRQSAA